MRDADLRAQRHVLPVAVVADAVDDELLGNELRDVRTELALDQVQHQVERRHAAGAGEAVAVDAEELVAQLDARKLLAQRREILPVDGRAVAIEQAGFRRAHNRRCTARRAARAARPGACSAASIFGDTASCTSTPPHTNRMSTAPTASRACVGDSCRPLLAGVGCPSRLTIDHSYTLWPVMLFAMRSGSTAFDSAIIE